jgi:hypothetical protein
MTAECSICGRELKREKEIEQGVHSICLARVNRKQEATEETEPEKPMDAVKPVKPTINNKWARFGLSGKTATIVIPRTNEEENPVVDVRLNDYDCRIKRDEEVTVPIEVLGVLNNSVETRWSYTEKLNEKGERVPIWTSRNVHRFPVQVIRRDT